VEELELGNDYNGHSNFYLPFAGIPEFQQSKKGEGANILIGQTG